MRILIVEDEKLAAEKLRKQLLELDEKIIVAGMTPSIEETVEWLDANEMPDLVFCDIHLADGLSFDIFKQRIVQSPVIFTTAYDHYAIRAFEVNSISYLLKPIQSDKLQESLSKYRNLRAHNAQSMQPAGQIDKLISIIQRGTTTTNYKQRFLVKVGTKIKSVPVNRVAYFFTEDRMNFIMTRDHDKLPIDHTLEELEDMLDPRHFFRLNRSYVVHYDAVKEIHTHFKGRVKVDLNPTVEEEIVISAEKTPLFKAWLDQ